MRRTVLVTALSAVALAGAAPAAAGAKPPPPPSRDTVTGNPTIGVGQPTSTYTIDAFGGPAGEAPGGTITVRGQLLNFDLAVTCLIVSGSRAVVAGRQEGNGNVLTIILELEDAPAGTPDRGAVSVYFNRPPPACADVDLGRPLDEVRFGSVTITDAPVPPVSRKACRKDGWQQLGFPSRRACRRAAPRASR